MENLKKNSLWKQIVLFLLRMSWAELLDLNKYLFLMEGIDRYPIRVYYSGVKYRMGVY